MNEHIVNPAGLAQRSRTGERGFALLAVLVTISVLLAIATPFVLSMGRGSQGARFATQEIQVDDASQSVRNALLTAAQESTFGIDPTQHLDGLDEFPGRPLFGDTQEEGPGGEPSSWILPEELDPRGDDDTDQILIGGSVEDEQRRIHLDSATPLVLANLLGLAARNTEKIEPDANEIVCSGSLEAFPDDGFVLIGREVISYGQRDGRRLMDIQRGQLSELGFASGPSDEAEFAIDRNSLILDFRCVAACILPHLRDLDPSTRKPLGDLRELGELSQLGVDPFTEAEIDTLALHVTTRGLRESSARFGRGSRVFSINPLGETAPQGVLLVRDASGMGAGRIVRVRSTDGQLQEYALVVSTAPRGNNSQFQFSPNPSALTLLQSLNQPFEPLETIVEPLVPVPVNVNTAGPEVLRALFANLRQVSPIRVRAGNDQLTRSPIPFAERRAEEVASAITLFRDPRSANGFDMASVLGEDFEVGEDFSFSPFAGWEDFHDRILPLLSPTQSSPTDDQRRLVLFMWDALLYGTPPTIEMGTVPICFQSAPLVRYRASASLLSAVGSEVARSERIGSALAVPGESLGFGAASQLGLEEFARLDRQSPYWIFGPNNTQAGPDESRIPNSPRNAHVAATLFPDLGINQPRFAGAEGDDAWVQPLSSTTPLGYQQGLYSFQNFWTELEPEGRDLTQLGSYAVRNIGPRASQAGGAPNSQQQAQPGDRLNPPFPFTMNGGLSRAFAAQFWFRIRDGGPQTLFELADAQTGADERSRYHVSLEDGTLVFEVVGDAGIDVSSRGLQTAVERTAGRWQVPVADLQIQPDRWTHVSVSAHGDRPGQLTFLVDGVPRGEPVGRTYLTEAIEAWAPNFGLADFRLDRDRFRRIRVENTDGFPPRGVLKIGRELFEYTSLDSGTFYLDYQDGMGGRAARTNIGYFNQLPTNDLNNPELVRQLTGQNQIESTTPDHPVGAAVELYGYSVPVYPARTLQPGQARLRDNLGPFAVARMSGGQALEPVFVVAGQQQILVGQGFTDTAQIQSIELADPVSAAQPAPVANTLVSDAFPASGGYALLIQRPATVQAAQQPGGGLVLQQAVPIGGMEVITYGSRQGNRLTGIRRGVTLPNLPQNANQQDRNQVGLPRTFVTDWEDRRDLQVNGIPLDEIPTSYPYVIPISINIDGNVDESGDVTNWVQITPPSTADTEWVRYDLVETGRIIRSDIRAFRRVVSLLLGVGALNELPYEVGGGFDLSEVYPEAPWPTLNPSFADPSFGPGYIDQIEILFPAINAARRGLRFRGDDLGEIAESDGRPAGTSSHQQPANTPVLPVHRFEYSNGAFGVTAPRVGIGDRVSLIQGSARQNGNSPGVEWHTVRWAARILANDGFDPETGATAEPRWGPFRFQLVAFEDQVTQPFFGEQVPFPFEENRNDPRLLDRMVKFPSGELPVADADQAFAGGDPSGVGNPSTGVIDELGILVRQAAPRPLDQNIDESVTEFFVRPSINFTSAGDLGYFDDEQGNRIEILPRQWQASILGNRVFPQDGGMIQIDSELMVYESYDPGTGRIQLSPNARGLLGTQARGHAEGAQVHFLEQVPASPLTSGLSQNDSELLVRSVRGFPRFEGTVLVGQEMIHYTWIRAGNALGMPLWRDPADPRAGAEGLFRGRYGTQPNTAPNGTPAIWFPHRYWDRYHERADDPALAHLQVTLDHGPAWFEGFAWKAQNDEELVGVQALVRVDEEVPWFTDPDEDDRLMLFDNGTVDDQPNAIDRFGRKFQARLQLIYSPGAFDPVLFQAQAWKRAPRLEWWLLRYEGDPRVLDEEVRTR